MIKAQNLSVSYGTQPVIKNISVYAKSREITAVIGPNGSGKSTLIKALSGDLKYTGSIEISNTDVASATPAKLANRRAVLSQFSSVTFPFTVHEIVAMGARSGPFEKAFIKSGGIVNQALHRVGLVGFGGRLYHELSGGEQQRVQLARVLCQVWQPLEKSQPRWLFLDEPVSSLDIQHQIRIMEISRKYAHEGGGVLTIMHDLNLTAMYADYVLLMKNGKILCSGTPTEVVTDETMKEAYESDLKVSRIPPKNEPFVLPQSVRLC